MSQFKRSLPSGLMDALRGSELYDKKLKPDIESGEVFPAFRDGSIQFYCKGGCLFKFDNAGFKSHYKYLSAIDHLGDDYLTEHQFKDASLHVNFINGYEQTKENCLLYSNNSEAHKLSHLLEKFSWAKKGQKSPIVALDIEVSMPNDDPSEKKRQDKIDLALYDTENKVLHFVEAKDFSNKELFSRGTPKIVTQILRYQNQANQRQKQICLAYKNFVTLGNTLFDTTLAAPVRLSETVNLYLFGFDYDQANGRLEKVFKDNPEVKKHGVDEYTYALGNPRGISALKKLIRERT